MSLLGFDAVGRFSLGQVRGSTTTANLAASVGPFAVTGFPVTFTIKEAAASASLALTGAAASFAVSEAAAVGAFALAGKAASFAITEAVSAGAFTFNGTPVNETILEAEGAAAFTVTANDAQLSRTGFDYDFQQGGIGHLLMEMHRAKQLAAITRTIPPPVDRRTAPTFMPAARPAAGSPWAIPAEIAATQAAMQQKRAEAVAVASRAAKKRRDEEAILLLAS
ncbi:hypothetical protein [Bradyrhizobium sp. OK095]|uniref:hypothetical protein n=1 Tax=Bradyrhizobium sp. OK095 TaxID=1882760 RepID=UPI0008D50BBC|nr:hypothetical protein [Bradyrhizobium sp. OK095]SEN66925.1 hypothetical protein SAMN05443254_11026 [Bradyrhizobium sp. OK095]